MSVTVNQIIKIYLQTCVYNCYLSLWLLVMFNAINDLKYKSEHAVCESFPMVNLLSFQKLIVLSYTLGKKC